MAKKVQVNDFANEITKMLTEYTDEVTEIARGVVEKVAQGCADEIRNHIAWKDKKYSKSFDLKTTFDDKRNLRKTWYVKSPHYRLTHLLEFGHVTNYKTGKYGKQQRTKRYPHVQYGDKFVADNLEREMKEGIENARIKNNA